MITFNMPFFSIITLPPERWEEYRALRLEALQNDPFAFGSSYEEQTEKPREYWQERLEEKEDEFLLFAEAGGDLVGMVGSYLETKLKVRHIANLVAFYVTSSYRGKGVGEALLQAALNRIAETDRIHKIRLSVNVTQEPAIELYKKAGFEQVGYFKDELFVDGKYCDQIAMEKLI